MSASLKDSYARIVLQCSYNATQGGKQAQRCSFCHVEIASDSEKTEHGKDCPVRKVTGGLFPRSTVVGPLETESVAEAAVKSDEGDDEPT